jgi:hypothetical protein
MISKLNKKKCGSDNDNDNSDTKDKFESKSSKVNNEILLSKTWLNKCRLLRKEAIDNLLGILSTFKKNSKNDEIIYDDALHLLSFKKNNDILFINQLVQLYYTNSNEEINAKLNKEYKKLNSEMNDIDNLIDNASLAKMLLENDRNYLIRYKKDNLQQERRIFTSSSSHDKQDKSSSSSKKGKRDDKKKKRKI